MNSVTRALLIITLAVTTESFAQATPLSIRLATDPANPPRPTMGDQMCFNSVIANTGDGPVEGLVAWISLVEIDSGNEQPVDLEDWSAHKAVAAARLGPGETLESIWPMRLIQNGEYRVVISVTARNQSAVYTSPTVEFHVTRKPVVESIRILPVAFGVPLLLLGMLGYRRWQAGHMLRGSKNHTE